MFVSVDLDQFSSECQKAPISWLKVEDEEIKKCFQRHLLHRDYATVIEGDMALGLAKLLNWTVKRRTSSAIFQRIRALQIRYRKGIYSKVTVSARSKYCNKILVLRKPVCGFFYQV